MKHQFPAEHTHKISTFPGPKLCETSQQFPEETGFKRYSPVKGISPSSLCPDSPRHSGSPRSSHWRLFDRQEEAADPSRALWPAQSRAGLKSEPPLCAGAVQWCCILVKTSSASPSWWGCQKQGSGLDKPNTLWKSVMEPAHCSPETLQHWKKLCQLVHQEPWGLLCHSLGFF